MSTVEATSEVHTGKCAALLEEQQKLERDFKVELEARVRLATQITTEAAKRQLLEQRLTTAVGDVQRSIRDT